MVYIFLAPGFEEAEALVPADLLRRVGIETALVTLGDELVPGGHGITVKADLPLSAVELDKARLLVLPGGGLGVKNLGESPALEDLFHKAAARDIPLAAICAAPSLLGKWGLLEGKKAVCYPGWENKLTGAVPCPQENAVRDGSTVTGRAAGAAFDFGLALIALLAGEEKAQAVAKGVCWFR